MIHLYPNIFSKFPMTLINKTYRNITILTIITIMLASPGIINEAYADHDCVGGKKDKGMVTLSLVKAVAESMGGIAGAVTEDYLAAFGFGVAAAGDYATAFGKCSAASGDHSLASGYKAHASGDQSTAFGDNTKARGYNSASFGYNSHASGNQSATFGDNTKAEGHNSAAFGYNSHASGNNSVVFGHDSTASGTNSAAFGWFTTTSGGNSAAFGWLTTANGTSATAFGYDTTAQPYVSFVVGRYNEISGDNVKWVTTDPLFVIGNGDSSKNRNNAVTVLKNGNVGIGNSNPVNALAVGGSAIFGETTGIYKNVAGGINSAAFGGYTTASGTRSITTGWVTTAIGTNSAAFGGYTTASGDHSTAFGYNTKAKGISSVAFGETTIANGTNSAAFGHFTTASGNGSTAFGDRTTASGDNSTTFGSHTTAQPYSSFVVGQYNEVSDDYDKTSWVDTDPLFVIGNGYQGKFPPFTTYMHNAVTVLKNGNVGIGISSPNSQLEVTGYFELATNSTALLSTDCDATNEIGRMIVDSTNDNLYVCTNNGWQTK